MILKMTIVCVFFFLSGGGGKGRKVSKGDGRIRNPRSAVWGFPMIL